MVRLGFKNFLATTLFRSSKAAKVDLSNVDMDNVLFPNAAAPSALAASVASGDLPGPTRQPGQGIIHSSVAGLQTEGKRLRPTNLNTTAASKAAPGCPGGPRLSRGPPGLPGCQLGPSKAPQKTRPKFVRIICQDTARPKFVRSVSNICQLQTGSKTASKAAPGHPGGTKVKSWPPWTSGPSIKTTQGPKNSRPEFVRSQQEIRKNFVSNICQTQTTLKTASKAASGCPGGTKVRPWPPWTSWPSTKAIRGPKNPRPKFDRSLQGIRM